VVGVHAARVRAGYKTHAIEQPHQSILFESGLVRLFCFLASAAAIDPATEAGQVRAEERKGMRNVWRSKKSGSGSSFG
jgi:hypothetical protein